MADNIRPALYGAKYAARSGRRQKVRGSGIRGSQDSELVTIAGKVCESGDILIRDIELER